MCTIIQYLLPGEDFPSHLQDSPEFRAMIENVTRRRLQLREKDVVKIIFSEAPK